MTEREKEERKRKDKLREMARLLSQKIEQEKSELEEQEDQDCEDAEENQSQHGMCALNVCPFFLILNTTYYINVQTTPYQHEAVAVVTIFSLKSERIDR